jgi:hypothetical protein
MAEIIAKLMALSYEIIGVLLPGFVFAIYFVLLWYAIGSEAASLGFPIFTWELLMSFINSLNSSALVVATVPPLFGLYLIGQVILWAGKSWQPNCNGKAWQRFFSSLFFRIPKPAKSYGDSLKPLYDVASRKFNENGATPLEWSAFYPVAKTVLLSKLPTSLAVGYQNKYTFHRSIVVINVLFLWLALIAVVGNCALTSAPLQHRAVMTAMILVELFAAWSFSGSYQYYWKLWGDSIVAESYALLVIQNDIFKTK